MGLPRDTGSGGRLGSFDQGTLAEDDRPAVPVFNSGKTRTPVGISGIVRAGQFMATFR